MNLSIPTYDAIIAGAGPVGLFLACELRLGECSVLVLEQAPDPRSPFKTLPFGLRGLTVPTVDALDRRDLLESLAARAANPAAPEAHWMRQHRRPAGHFAGIQFFHDKIDKARWRYRLGPAKSAAADMASIEAVLTGRAEALGATIRRGYAVKGLEERGDEVLVSAGDDVFPCRWLTSSTMLSTRNRLPQANWSWTKSRLQRALGRASTRSGARVPTARRRARRLRTPSPSSR